MIEYISPSQMSTAFSCGEKYRMRYIEGVKIPPSLVFVRGLSVHKTSEVNLKQKISTKKDMPLEDMKDCTRDSFYKNIEDGIFLSKEQISAKSRLLNKTLSASLDLTELYKVEVAPDITKIVEVETFFDSYLEDLDVVLRGKPDVKTKTGIRDLKVTGVKMAEGQIQSELQPAFYGLADFIETGKTETKFFIDNLVSTKIPQVKSQTMVVGPAHHQAIKKKIAAFLKMIKTGTFLPPSPYPAWVCTPKYCGYHGVCNFTK